MVLIGTVICSLDRLLYLFDKGARQAEISQTLNSPLLNQVPGVLGERLISQSAPLISLAVNLTVGCTILGWCGFAIYIYFRREYFA